MNSPTSKARSRYSAFHGHAPRQVRRVKVRPIRELICLASADTITYKSDKTNGGRDGTPQYFEHKFRKKIKIYTTPEGDLLLIGGPGLRVTSRGIVG